MNGLRVGGRIGFRVGGRPVSTVSGSVDVKTVSVVPDEEVAIVGVVVVVGVVCRVKGSKLCDVSVVVDVVVCTAVV